MLPPEVIVLVLKTFSAFMFGWLLVLALVFTSLAKFCWANTSLIKEYEMEINNAKVPTIAMNR